MGPPRCCWLPPGAAGLLAAILLAGLGFAGLFTWLWFWLGGRLPESVRMLCPSCGVPLEFAAQNLGQVIPCPHCAKAVTLRKPGDLKMSCFFCQGHIEFPAHALGTKMPCPHCKRDITLIERT